MSRRKHLAIRNKDGRIARQPTELASPTEIRRLREASLSGLKDASWSSQIGRLHLTGKLTSSEFAMARRWAEISANYSWACNSPAPPRTLSLDNRGGEMADPDSTAGKQQVRRHLRATSDYLEARFALQAAGAEVMRVIELTVISDQAPAYSEMSALHKGLAALAKCWEARKQRHARR